MGETAGTPGQKEEFGGKGLTRGCAFGGTQGGDNRPGSFVFRVEREHGSEIIEHDEEAGGGLSVVFRKRGGAERKKKLRGFGRYAGGIISSKKESKRVTRRSRLRKLKRHKNNDSQKRQSVKNGYLLGGQKERKSAPFRM